MTASEVNRFFKKPPPVSCAATTRRRLVSLPEVGVASSGKHESVSAHYPRLWRVDGKGAERLWVSVEKENSNLSAVPADFTRHGATAAVCLLH